MNSRDLRSVDEPLVHVPTKAYSLGLSVCEAGVPKPGANRECSPTFLVPHIRDFAQALNDGIVVHDNRGFFSPVRRQGMKDCRRLCEAARRSNAFG